MRQAVGGEMSYKADGFHFLWGTERAHMTDYLIETDWEILDWHSKISFLEKAETAVRSGVKPRFSVKALAQVTPFWTCGLLFNYFQLENNPRTRNFLVLK